MGFEKAIVLSLIWGERASRDLEGIVEYIAERNEPAAARIKALAETCAERLPHFPFMYRAGRIPGTREAVIHPNYILIYRVLTDAVEIVSVIHARREYP